MKYLNYIFFALFTLNAFAGEDGPGVSGGGLEVERNFVAVARVVSENIQTSLSSSEKVFEGFNLPAFEAAIERTHVQALEELCFDQLDLITGKWLATRCLDAEYFQKENRIDVSIKNWQTKNCIQKMGVVLHEYGRASANEDSNYKYSSRLSSSAVIRGACERWDLHQRYEGTWP